MDLTPKRPDGRPAWRVLYDEVVARIETGKLGVGDIIPHDEFKALLNEREIDAYYSLVGKASEQMAKKMNRVLDAVRGCGYRLTAGLGQVDMGKRQHKKAKTNLKKASFLVKTTDFRLLSPEERSETKMMMTILANHEFSIRNLHASAEERKAESEDLKKTQEEQRKTQQQQQQDIDDILRWKEEMKKRFKD